MIIHFKRLNFLGFHYFGSKVILKNSSKVLITFAALVYSFRGVFAFFWLSHLLLASLFLDLSNIFQASVCWTLQLLTFCK